MQTLTKFSKCGAQHITSFFKNCLLTLLKRKLLQEPGDLCAASHPPNVQYSQHSRTHTRRTGGRGTLSATAADCTVPSTAALLRRSSHPATATYAAG